MCTKCKNMLSRNGKLGYKWGGFICARPSRRCRGIGPQSASMKKRRWDLYISAELISLVAAPGSCQICPFQHFNLHIGASYLELWPGTCIAWLLVNEGMRTTVVPLCLSLSSRKGYHGSLLRYLLGRSSAIPGKHLDSASLVFALETFLNMMHSCTL